MVLRTNKLPTRYRSSEKISRYSSQVAICLGFSIETYLGAVYLHVHHLSHSCIYGVHVQAAHTFIMLDPDLNSHIVFAYVS